LNKLTAIQKLHKYYRKQFKNENNFVHWQVM